MSEENISTCRMCGTVMFRSTRDLCSKCSKNEEELFQKTRNFLRANPGATVEQVARFLDCNPDTITGFITSGRLARAGIRRIAHECQLCRSIIYEGNLCADCEKNLQTQVTSLQKSEETKDPKDIKPTKEPGA